MTESTKDKILATLLGLLGLVVAGLYNFISTTNTDLVLEKERSKRVDKEGERDMSKLDKLHGGLDAAKDARHQLELRIQKLETKSEG